MIRHCFAVPLGRSLHSPIASLAVVACALLAVAACGSDEDTGTPFTGTFDVTSIDCNGLAAGVDPLAVARIASGRTWTWTFSGNGRATIELADPSCTLAAQFNVRYISETRLGLIGTGSYACDPSAAVCDPFLTTVNPVNVCGVANGEAATFDHGTVPQSAGGTMVLSRVEDSGCGQRGGTEPLRLVLTRR